MKAIILSVAAMAALAASPVRAATVHTMDPSQMVRVLQGEGYTAKITIKDSGRPVIESASNGANFSIYFYGCTGQVKCTAMQYYAGFHFKDSTPSQSKINQWNTDRRYFRSYIDSDGDPNVEYDVDLQGGYTDEILVESIRVWAEGFPLFMKHIGWN